jgi:mono/diheme cytochrome c family protein
MTKGKGTPRTAAVAAAVATLLLAGAALAADAPKKVSSCIACHTDAAKLQEEAKGIPVPSGSALQAGKG